MKYYNRRVYKNYMGDGRAKKHIWNGKHAIGDLVNCNMKDTDDVIISSEQFAKEYAQHLVELAQRKNKEYTAIGILDTNDLIQIANECFLIAWKRVDWTRINKLAEKDRKAALWGFLKKNIVLDLNKEIRRIKDGIRVPVREQFQYSDESSKGGAQFDAITQMFPQLQLEMMYANEKAADTSYHNDLLMDILDDHFNKYLGIGTKKKQILEWSLGVNADKLSSSEIGDRLKMSDKAVRWQKLDALKTLKSEESLKDLAFAVDGACIPTGANLLSYLESI